VVIKDGYETKRLVSLWAIVKPFRARAFLGMSALSGLLYFKGKLQQIKPDKENENPLDDDNTRAELDIALTFLEENCIELGLTASVATIKKLKGCLAEGKHKNQKLYPLGDELQGRLIDEMDGKSLWSLTIAEAEYYSNPKKGWEEAVNRFPTAISDVEEASKCFALSRYAACIYHSIQVVEAGLIELGKFISVEDPKSGWTAVANKLKKIISKKYEDRTDFEKQNFEFLVQVQGTVEALKNAWRNKISHVEGRLILVTKDFSPEVAEEILFATRAFMRRLANGLPQH